MAFFLRRQRELHLMRARTGMRQLVWYKAIFAISRFRFMLAFAAKGREQARNETLALTQKSLSPKARSGADGLPVFAQKSEQMHSHSSGFNVGKSTSLGRASSAGGPNTASGKAVRDMLDEYNNSFCRSKDRIVITRARSDSKESVALTTRGKSKSNLIPVEETAVNEESEEDLHRRMFEMLQARLLRQGFYILPRPALRRKVRPLGHHAGAGARRRTTTVAGEIVEESGTEIIVRDLADRLGRHVDLIDSRPLTEDQVTGVAGSLLKDLGLADIEEAKIAAKEVVDATLVVQVRPHELARLGKDDKAKMMGLEGFGTFYRKVTAKAAEEIVKRRALEANKPVALTGQVQKIRYVKRYRLRFFDEDLPDLPWLTLNQSLMLVIQGKSAFHSPVERSLWETKMKVFNEERKAALKAPGLFAPIEAALWSHPVVLARTARLQKAQTRGEGAAAWKGSVFEGRWELSSGRDSAGDHLINKQPTDGALSLMLRRTADMAGPFVVSRNANSKPLSLKPDKLQTQDTFIATRTASGFPVRPFGGIVGFRQEGSHETVFRPACQEQILPSDAFPKDLRLEELRKRRHARDLQQARLDQSSQLRDDPKHTQYSKDSMETTPSSPSKAPESLRSTSIRARTVALVADGDARAQRRCRDRIMDTDVSKGVKQFKEKVMPYFDRFIQDESTVASSFLRHASSGTASLEESSYNTGLAAAEAACSLEASLGFAGMHLTDMLASEDDPKTKKSASSTSPVPKAKFVPKTAADIGIWLENNNPLHTILDRGMDNRCAVGWKSGFRADPMSSEEIVAVRTLERNNCAPGRGIRVRAGTAPFSAR
eukprot:TRINITY_DN78547_c2_g1_i1.p1 TRINITY_DN78547_c2_g1~~TRINITY_DN78547_c2_g1_i1.p1  ORF type:complete len:870 (-),score=154.21 TRINITY_DN78547_c2_g1_i1:124-2610(-)